MPWIGPVIGLAGNAIFGDDGGGGGGGGGSQYVPTGLGAADAGWQSAFANQGYYANRGASGAMPGFDASLAASRGISYQDYLAQSARAGGAYGQAGDLAMGQIGGYGQQAGMALGQEQAMYGAGQRVMDTAFDPQNSLYARTAQRTQDQIRNGQAVRGLGNSEVGAMEEGGIMSNFNIDWENAQLGRQATGIQAGSQASGAGAAQGRMYGADASAALASAGAGAGYYGQAGQVPLTAQEYAAGAPGRASQAYLAGTGAIQQGYANYQGAAIPYMNAGNGAIQGNYQNAYQANRDMVSGISQFGNAVGPSVAGWFNNGGSGAQAAFSQTGVGSSGFGTGMAYGNQDYGSYF